LTDEDRVFELQRMQLMQLFKIYDVLLVLLRQTDKEAADLVLEEHSNFRYIGPLPFTTEENDGNAQEE
jgi:hypothetical protein